MITWETQTENGIDVAARSTLVAYRNCKSILEPGFFEITLIQKTSKHYEFGDDGKSHVSERIDHMYLISFLLKENKHTRYMINDSFSSMEKAKNRVESSMLDLQDSTSFYPVYDSCQGCRECK